MVVTRIINNFTKQLSYSWTWFLAAPTINNKLEWISADSLKNKIISFLNDILTNTNILDYFAAFIEGVFIFIGLLTAVAFYTLAERKIMSAIQRRRGPNVAGLWGVLQPLLDGVKLMKKENIIPRYSAPLLFIIAPIISFVGAVTNWGIIPLNPVPNFSDLPLNILIVFAISSVAVYGLIIGGWSSNSKYAFLGSLRSSAQVISYEIVLSFIFVSLAYVAGSFNLIDIVLVQQSSTWFFIQLWPLALLFFIVMFAETNRTPFDLPEAEAEIVAGYNIEYSGISFALFFLAEYANMYFFSLLFVFLFLGGADTSSQIMYILTVLFKGLPIAAFFVVVRAALPRYRYDMLMKLGWYYLIPLSFVIFQFILFSNFFFLWLPSKNIILKNFNFFVGSTKKYKKLFWHLSLWAVLFPVSLWFITSQIFEPLYYFIDQTNYTWQLNSAPFFDNSQYLDTNNIVNSEITKSLLNPERTIKKLPQFDKVIIKNSLVPQPAGSQVQTRALLNNKGLLKPFNTFVKIHTTIPQSTVFEYPLLSNESQKIVQCLDIINNERTNNRWLKEQKWPDVFKFWNWPAQGDSRDNYRDKYKHSHRWLDNREEWQWFEASLGTETNELYQDWIELKTDNYIRNGYKQIGYGTLGNNGNWLNYCQQHTKNLLGYMAMPVRDDHFFKWFAVNYNPIFSHALVQKTWEPYLTEFFIPRDPEEETCIGVEFQPQADIYAATLGDLFEEEEVIMTESLDLRLQQAKVNPEAWEMVNKSHYPLLKNSVSLESETHPAEYINFVHKTYLALKKTKDVEALWYMPRLNWYAVSWQAVHEILFDFEKSESFFKSIRAVDYDDVATKSETTEELESFEIGSVLVDNMHPIVSPKKDYFKDPLLTDNWGFDTVRLPSFNQKDSKKLDSAEIEWKPWVWGSLVSFKSNVLCVLEQGTDFMLQHSLSIFYKNQKDALISKIIVLSKNILQPTTVLHDFFLRLFYITLFFSENFLLIDYLTSIFQSVNDLIAKVYMNYRINFYRSLKYFHLCIDRDLLSIPISELRLPKLKEPLIFFDLWRWEFDESPMRSPPNVLKPHSYIESYTGAGRMFLNSEDPTYDYRPATYFLPSQWEHYIILTYYPVLYLLSTFFRVDLLYEFKFIFQYISWYLIIIEKTVSWLYGWWYYILGPIFQQDGTVMSSVTWIPIGHTINIPLDFPFSFNFYTKEFVGENIEDYYWWQFFKEMRFELFLFYLWKLALLRPFVEYFLVKKYGQPYAAELRKKWLTYYSDKTTDIYSSEFLLKKNNINRWHQLIPQYFRNFDEYGLLVRNNYLTRVTNRFTWPYKTMWVRERDALQTYFWWNLYRRRLAQQRILKDLIFIREEILPFTVPSDFDSKSTLQSQFQRSAVNKKLKSFFKRTATSSLLKENDRDENMNDKKLLNPPWYDKKSKVRPRAQLSDIQLMDTQTELLYDEVNGDRLYFHGPQLFSLGLSSYKTGHSWITTENSYPYGAMLTRDPTDYFIYDDETPLEDDWQSFSNTKKIRKALFESQNSVYRLTDSWFQRTLFVPRDIQEALTFFKRNQRTDVELPLTVWFSEDSNTLPGVFSKNKKNVERVKVEDSIFERSLMEQENVLNVADQLWLRWLFANIGNLNNLNFRSYSSGGVNFYIPEIQRMAINDTAQVKNSWYKPFFIESSRLKKDFPELLENFNSLFYSITKKDDLALILGKPAVLEQNQSFFYDKKVFTEDDFDDEKGLLIDTNDTGLLDSIENFNHEKAKEIGFDDPYFWYSYPSDFFSSWTPSEQKLFVYDKKLDSYIDDFIDNTEEAFGSSRETTTRNAKEFFDLLVYLSQQKNPLSTENAFDYIFSDVYNKPEVLRSIELRRLGSILEKVNAKTKRRAKGKLNFLSVTPTEYLKMFEVFLPDWVVPSYYKIIDKLGLRLDFAQQSRRTWGTTASRKRRYRKRFGKRFYADMDYPYANIETRHMHPLPLSVFEFAHRSVPGYFFRHQNNTVSEFYEIPDLKTRYTTAIDLTDANLLLWDLMHKQRKYVRLLERDQERLMKKVFVDQQEFIDTWRGLAKKYNPYLYYPSLPKRSLFLRAKRKAYGTAGFKGRISRRLFRKLARLNKLKKKKTDITKYNLNWRPYWVFSMEPTSLDENYGILRQEYRASFIARMFTNYKNRLSAKQNFAWIGNPWTLGSSNYNYSGFTKDDFYFSNASGFKLKPRKKFGKTWLEKKLFRLPNEFLFPDQNKTFIEWQLRNSTLLNPMVFFKCAFDKNNLWTEFVNIKNKNNKQNLRPSTIGWENEPTFLKGSEKTELNKHIIEDINKITKLNVKKQLTENESHDWKYVGKISAFGNNFIYEEDESVFGGETLTGQQLAWRMDYPNVFLNTWNDWSLYPTIMPFVPHDPKHDVLGIHRWEFLNDSSLQLRLYRELDHFSRYSNYWRAVRDRNFGNTSTYVPWRYYMINLIMFLLGLFLVTPIWYFRAVGESAHDYGRDLSDPSDMELNPGDFYKNFSIKRYQEYKAWEIRFKYFDKRRMELIFEEYLTYSLENELFLVDNYLDLTHRDWINHEISDEFQSDQYLGQALDTRLLSHNKINKELGLYNGYSHSRYFANSDILILDIEHEYNDIPVSAYGRFIPADDVFTANYTPYGVTNTNEISQENVSSYWNSNFYNVGFVKNDIFLGHIIENFDITPPLNIKDYVSVESIILKNEILTEKEVQSLMSKFDIQKEKPYKEYVKEIEATLGYSSSPIFSTIEKEISLYGTIAEPKWKFLELCSWTYKMALREVIQQYRVILLHIRLRIALKFSTFILDNLWVRYDGLVRAFFAPLSIFYYLHNEEVPLQYRKPINLYVYMRLLLIFFKFRLYTFLKSIKNNKFIVNSCLCCLLTIRTFFMNFYAKSDIWYIHVWCSFWTSNTYPFYIKIFMFVYEIIRFPFICFLVTVKYILCLIIWFVNICTTFFMNFIKYTVFNFFLNKFFSLVYLQRPWWIWLMTTVYVSLQTRNYIKYRLYTIHKTHKLCKAIEKSVFDFEKEMEFFLKKEKTQAKINSWIDFLQKATINFIDLLLNLILSLYPFNVLLKWQLFLYPSNWWYTYCVTKSPPKWIFDLIDRTPNFIFFLEQSWIPQEKDLHIVNETKNQIKEGRLFCEKVHQDWFLLYELRGTSRYNLISDWVKSQNKFEAQLQVHEIFQKLRIEKSN